MLTTSDAADLIGVRYETVRNWLKKGLLDRGPATRAGSTRKWRDYSPTDIVCLHLARSALDAGVPLDVIVDVCTDPELAHLIEAEGGGPSAFGNSADTLLLVWTGPPSARFMFVPDGSVADELRRNPDPVTVINLGHTIRKVAAKLAQ